MSNITGRIIQTTNATLPVPTEGRIVENATALRALVGSTDLPAVTLLQHGAVDYYGGGTFRWDADAGTDDSGTRFNAGGHGTSGVGWVRVYNGPVFASWFGCAANGVADDTAALQYAVDAAMAGRRHLILEPGVYRLTDTVTISQGIALEGQVKASTTGTPSVKILWDPAAPSDTQACLLLNCADSVLAGWRVANLLIFQGSTVGATGAGYGIHIQQSGAGYKPSWVFIHDCLIDAFDADPWTKGIYVEGTEATAGDRPRDIYIDRVRITGTAPEDGGDWLLGGAGIHLYRAANVSIKDTLCNNSSRLLIDAPTDEDYTSSVWVLNCTIGSLDLGFAKDVYVRGGRYNDIRCDANSTSNVLEPDFVAAITLPLGGSANLLRVPEWANAAWVQNYARYVVKSTGDTTPLEQVAAEVVKFGSAGDLRFAFGTVPTIGTSNPGDAVFPQGGGVWGVNAAADGTVRIGLVGGDNNVYSGNEGAGSIVAGKYVYLAGTTSGPKIAYSSDSPEGALLGNAGDLCVRTAGSAGTSLYVKESGTATNTGWVAYTSGTGYGAADEVLQTNASGTAQEWGKVADANVATAAAIATSKLALTPSTAQQYPYSSAANTLSYLAGAAGKVAGWDQDGNVAAIYTYKSIVFLAVAPSSALSLGAHPSGEQDLANSDDLRQNGAYLDDCTQYRLHATIIAGSASANTPVLYVQYSDDDSAWSDGDAGPATISLTTAGRYTTAWTNMATTFKTDDIYVRVAQAGGDDTAMPSVSNVWVEFR